MENQGLTARSAEPSASEDASDLNAWEREEIDGSAFTGECLVDEIDDGTRVACDLTGAELLVADVNADPARKRHELIDYARSGDAALRHAIAAAVFEYQPHFCREGIRGLLPLSARQVADYLATHESTVSRAIKDFFVETPLGLFPLRFFFSPGVRREGGGAMSARAVRQELKEIIQEESSESPLTDEELANALRRRGYKIARRTIAKYRQCLGVPESQMRRS